MDKKWMKETITEYINNSEDTDCTGIPSKLFIELSDKDHQLLSYSKILLVLDKEIITEDDIDLLSDEYTDEEIKIKDKLFSNCTFNNCTIVYNSSNNITGSNDDQSDYTNSKVKSDIHRSLLNNLSGYDKSVELDKLIDKSSDNKKIDKLIEEVSSNIHDKCTEESVVDDDPLITTKDEKGFFRAWQLINLEAYPGVKLIKNYKDYFVLDFNEFISTNKKDEWSIQLLIRLLRSNEIINDYYDGLLTVRQAWRWARFDDLTLYPKSSREHYDTKSHTEDFTNEYNYIVTNIEDLKSVLSVDSTDEVLNFLDTHNLNDYEYDNSKNTIKFYYTDSDSDIEFVTLVKNSKSRDNNSTNLVSLANNLDNLKSKVIKSNEVIPKCLITNDKYTTPNHPMYNDQWSIQLHNQFSLLESIKDYYNEKDNTYNISYDNLVKELGIEDQYPYPREFNKNYLDTEFIKYDYKPSDRSYVFKSMSEEDISRVHNYLVNDAGVVITEDDLYNEKLSDKIKDMIFQLRSYLPFSNRSDIDIENQHSLYLLLIKEGYKFVQIHNTDSLATELSIDMLQEIMRYPSNLSYRVILEVLCKNNIEYEYSASNKMISIFKPTEILNKECNYFWYNRMNIDFGYTIKTIMDKPYKEQFPKYLEFLNSVYQYRDKELSTDDRYFIKPEYLAPLIDTDYNNNDTSDIIRVLNKKYFKYSITQDGLFLFKVSALFK